MKKFWGILFLFAMAGSLQGQDFLGTWKILKVFTTANLDKEMDNRMMLLVAHVAKNDSQAGVVQPLDATVEFSINPSNKAQHVTLSSEGLLLMSLNWRVRESPTTEEATDIALKVWSNDETDYNIYTMLYNDSQTLVFTDRSKTGSKFVDIYYLEKKN